MPPGSRRHGRGGGGFQRKGGSRGGQAVEVVEVVEGGRDQGRTSIRTKIRPKKYVLPIDQL